MVQFKRHAKEDVAGTSTTTLPSSTSTGSARDNSALSTVVTMSLQHHGSNGGEEAGKAKQQISRGDAFRLIYLGNYEISPPAVTGDGQVHIIDSLVAKVRASMPAQTGGKNIFHKKKKAIGSQLHRRNSFTRKSSFSKSPPEVVRAFSASEDDHRSTEQQLQQGHSEPDISVTPHIPSPDMQSDSSAELFTSANGDLQERQRESPSLLSSLLPGNSHKTSVVQPDKTAESSEYDIIPELGTLQKSSEFQSLSLSPKEEAPKFCKVKVQLVFSGVHVVVQAEDSSAVLVRKPVKTISCCAQVRGGGGGGGKEVRDKGQ